METIKFLNNAGDTIKTIHEGIKELEDNVFDI